MKRMRPCGNEPELRERAARRALSPDDRAHLGACATCRVALELDRRLPPALAGGAEAPPAAAGALLLRARLRARREAERRSLAPLRAWRLLAATAVLAGLAAVALLGGLLDAESWHTWSPGDQLFALGAAGAVLLALRSRPGRSSAA